ncbi:MAG: hypothetical protein EOP53_20165 [Sphingobacteriales bacterium]|nr:MAG: hypothetical protein EOP53_20165 [Sphingobacteriales bacterium]
MNLTDETWKKHEGGYRKLYDPSIPLRKLEKATNPRAIQKIFSELWNELHHQGDVGVASYLALPQLIRICKSKEIFDYNLLALCSVIEQQRHLGANPNLPIEFKEYYLQGLLELQTFVIANIEKELANSVYTVALATLATCSGRIKLGKAIMELEDEEILDDFLEQF